jgi:hypothetical protein
VQRVVVGGAAGALNAVSVRPGSTGRGIHGMNGRPGGDPARLAAALVRLVGSDAPPLRWAAAADAVAAFEDKARMLVEQAGACREVSSSLGHDDVL